MNIAFALNKKRFLALKLFVLIALMASMFGKQAFAQEYKRFLFEVSKDTSSFKFVKSLDVKGYTRFHDESDGNFMKFEFLDFNGNVVHKVGIKNPFLMSKDLFHKSNIEITQSTIRVLDKSNVLLNLPANKEYASVNLYCLENNAYRYCGSQRIR